MDELLVEEEYGDGIRVLKLNKTPVNALDAAFLDAIDTKLTALASDPDVRALIITADGRSLSAGLDLKWVASADAADQMAMVDALNHTFLTLYTFPKPVITAANGHAIAGGLFFILCGDYRLAVQERAQLGLTEVRVGLSFPIGPLEIARAQLSPQALRRLMGSGRNIDSQTAQTWGILDELVKSEELLARSLAVAEDYAGIPPIAFAGVKAQMRAPAINIIKEALAQKSDVVRAAWFSEETSTSATALLKAAKARVNQ